MDIDKGVRSVEFEIDDGVYRNVLKHAVRMYFYQRAGFKKTTETAGPDWADAASHMGPGQTKYTSWAARTLIVLLRACSENPSAFGDDTGIAESGNGVPDILVRS